MAAGTINQILRISKLPWLPHACDDTANFDFGAFVALDYERLVFWVGGSWNKNGLPVHGLDFFQGCLDKLAVIDGPLDMDNHSRLKVKAG